jgi:hypothetical protein
MNISQFRKAVKTEFPHVKISIRTVNFQDLARDSKKFLTVNNENQEELITINAWAREVGIMPDTNIRCR